MILTQLREDIIIPTLDFMKHGSERHVNSPSAVRLLEFTGATETLCGKYIKQYPSGVGLGMYQIEPNTYYDLHQNYLIYRPEFLKVLRELQFVAEFGVGEPNLIGNLYYSTAVARLIYWRQPETLPKVDDNEGMWQYYKKYFNTEKGKATREKFFENAKYCGVIE